MCVFIIFSFGLSCILLCLHFLCVIIKVFILRSEQVSETPSSRSYDVGTKFSTNFQQQNRNFSMPLENAKVSEENTHIVIR